MPNAATWRAARAGNSQSSPAAASGRKIRAESSGMFIGRTSWRKPRGGGLAGRFGQKQPGFGEEADGQHGGQRNAADDVFHRPRLVHVVAALLRLRQEGLLESPEQE